MQATVNKLFRSILFLLLVTLSAFAQQDKFYFNHITVKDGLSHGIVNCFYRDSEGFLWIGTYNGLNRYDGSNFLVMKSNRHNSHSLLNNSIHGITEDKNGLIYCATEGGLSCYNKSLRQFDNYQIVDDSVNDATAMAGVKCDRQGRIWCLTPRGLYEFIPATKKFKRYKHIDGDSTTLSSDVLAKNGMAEDPVRKGIWLATDKGLNFFDTEKNIVYNYKNNPMKWKVFDDHHIFPIHFDQWNKLHYGDNNNYEYCVFDIEKNEVIRRTITEHSRRNNAGAFAQIFPDSKGNTWICTWSYTLYFVDGNTNEIKEIWNDKSNPQSINADFFWDVYEDKEGTIWIGGLNGISYFNPEKISYQIYKPKDEYPIWKKYNKILSFYEDSDSLLWFGTEGNGLFSYDFKKEEYHNYNMMPPGIITDRNYYKNSVLSISENNNVLWLGTRDGLFLFDKEKKKFKEFKEIYLKDSSGDAYIMNVIRDNSGMMWINLWGYGIYVVNPDNYQYTHYVHKDGDSTSLLEDNIAWMYKDDKGRMWLGTFAQKGIQLFNERENNFRLYTTSERDQNGILTTGAMFGLYNDNAGNLWITSKGDGLIKLNPETGAFKTFRESDGLAYDHSMAIVKDNFGKLWIAGYNLVTVVDPVKEKFENFAIKYGETDYQYRNKMYLLKNGKIASSILGAFVILDPSKQQDNFKPQPVIISSFKVFEKEFPFINGEDVHLSYKQNFFSIAYSLLSGVDREKYHFQYKLEGFDKDWVDAGKRQLATYTNVPGGNYIFKVKAINSLGQETEHLTTINISITKIFYQTWWFRFIMAFTMFMIIRLYVRYRERQQKQLEAEQAITYFANSEYTNSNAEEILWDMARNCISRLGFEDCVIYLIDEDKDALIQKAALGAKTMDLKTITNPIEIPVGKGIVGSVAVSGKTERINDTSKDSRYILDDAMRFSEITVPIVHEGKVIGVIDSEHHKKHFFTKEHQSILETMASICATKIVNAQAVQVLAEKEIKLLEIDKKVAETRLMALRAQMNPHFIFNCLNAIDNYILKNDADQASRYLNKFARLVRSILSESDKNFITLKKELDLLNNYIELENIRLTEKFDYTLQLDPSIDINDIEIPTMVLQPFVENAIVHGLAHQTGKKTLSISISLTDETLKCIIEDSGVGREEALRIKNSKIQTHESKGMRVTEGRLELLQQEVKEKGTVIITDLYDAEGKPAGTRVEINVPFEEN